MTLLRPADLEDLDFLVWINQEGEGLSTSYMTDWSDDDWIRHRAKIRDFIESPDKVAFVLVDQKSAARVGATYARFRDRFRETFESWSVLGKIEERHFLGDGRFCEVFELWVHPDHRRRGFATTLKTRLEEVSLDRGVFTMYTHTEASNSHVIELNQKLGYFEVRRGPIWDEVPRVSLIKHLRGDGASS